MNLQYSGQELVNADPGTVWAFIQDPAKVGACLPDVESVRVIDPRSFDATVRVGVGLVRGRFVFRVNLVPDEAAGRMGVNLTGGGLGSSLDLRAGANVVDRGDGSTRLDWNGEVGVSGTVASVGGRLLDTQARRLITQTFANMASALGGSARRT